MYIFSRCNSWHTCQNVCFSSCSSGHTCRIVHVRMYISHTAALGTLILSECTSRTLQLLAHISKFTLLYIAALETLVTMYFPYVVALDIRTCQNVHFFAHLSEYTLLRCSFGHTYQNVHFLTLQLWLHLSQCTFLTL